MSKDITVIVDDANDNAPTFQDTPYNIEVPEVSPALSVTTTPCLSGKGEDTMRH